MVILAVLSYTKTIAESIFSIAAKNDFLYTSYCQLFELWSAVIKKYFVIFLF